MTYRRKVDRNQRDIVRMLRACGCSVVSLHRVGQGVPDLLVGARGRNLLLEVKPEGVKRYDQQEQEKWRAAWRGQVVVVRNIDDAIRAIGGLNGH